MKLSDKILVTGHKGLVGSALIRYFHARGYENVITWDRKAVDLRDPVAVKWAFSVYQPRYVFMAGARVGGIKANMEDQVGFLLDNWNIQQNVMVNAHESGVHKLLFLGSSCIYPEHATNPITEDALLSGKLQPANEGYALAKICGLKLGQYFRRQHQFDVISAQPCNLFGPNDNFNEHTAHVIPGMMARMYRAAVAGDPVFEVWGSPDASRELLFSDNLADALVFLMKNYSSDEPINVGSDDCLSMDLISKYLARTLKYRGELKFTGEHVGTQHKKMSTEKLARLGWYPKTLFEDALNITFKSYLSLYEDPSTPAHRISRNSLPAVCGT